MPFFPFGGVYLTRVVVAMALVIAVSRRIGFCVFAVATLGTVRGVVGSKAAEPVFALFQIADGRINGLGLAVAAIFGPDRAMPGFAVIRVDHMAAGAARLAIVAGLIIGSHEPHERIVEPGLVDIEYRNGDAQAGSGTAVGLFQVRTTGLFQPLDDAADIGQSDFRELSVDIAATALEYAENIAWRNRMPGRQGIEDWQGPAILLRIGHGAVRIAGRLDRRRLALARIGFAKHVIFERDNAVIIGSATPQHCTGCHQRPLGRLDDLHMACTAGFARDPIVGRIDETHKFRRFRVQQGIAALRIGGRRPMPAFRIFGQNMRFFERIHIGEAVLAPFVVADDRGVAAMAIHAAQNHGRGLVHGLLVTVGVAGLAAAAFGLRFVPGLVLRGRGRETIVDFLRFFFPCGEQQGRRG